MSAPPTNTPASAPAFEGDIHKFKVKELRQLFEALGMDPAKKDKDTLVRILDATLFRDQTSNEEDPSANLKLHQQKATTDPPPSFGPLGLQIKTGGGKFEVAGGSSPLSSGSVSLSPGEDKDKDETAEGDGKVVKPAKGTVKVLVKVHPHRGNTIPVENIYVKSVPVTTSETPNGSLNTALLTNLIPSVLGSNSPMKKDSGGRFYCAGLFNAVERMEIGSVEQHLKGSIPNNLSWETGNNIALHEIEKDLFGADIYFDSSPSVPQPPTSLTGASTDQPLLIAKERAKTSKSGETRKLSETDEVKAFIRAIAKSEKLPNKKNDNGLIGKKNYFLFMDFLEPFHEYEGKDGGYIIPADWEAPSHVSDAVANWQDYRNTSFTKDDIIRSAGWRTTATNINNGIFRDALAAGGDISQWVTAQIDGLDEAQCKRLDRKFGLLKHNALKALVKSLLEDAMEEVMGDIIAGPVAGPSKKRKHHKDTAEKGGDDADDADEQKKKKKKKGDDGKSSKSKSKSSKSKRSEEPEGKAQEKGRKGINEDNLDATTESSSSSSEDD
ncbi:hypothetical protein DFH06DRAFT_1292262 [Mycena polygramma]|nr:hypothetical protein DFH06DRAFT_1292262 [Mycena polygramma]